jgi:hypothetical protein
LSSTHGSDRAAAKRQQNTVAVVDQFAPKHQFRTDVAVFTQDLDEAPAFNVRGYDYLLLLDDQHLKSPEQFLERLRAQFDYRRDDRSRRPTCFDQRFMLLLGQSSTRQAIFCDAHALLHVPVAAPTLVDAFPLQEPAACRRRSGAGQRPARRRDCGQPVLIRCRPMFSYQFVIAQGDPDADFILDDAAG